MELSTALAKATQILDEERMRPTVSYEPVPPNPQLAGGSKAMAALAVFGHLGNAQTLSYEHKQRPRRVHESPDQFLLKSVNYELLLALFSQVPVSDRPAFADALITRARRQTAVRRTEDKYGRFPSWDYCVSETPLICEFCIRVEFKTKLIRAISESPLTHGIVLLLMQLEETIALNFNVFSEHELGQLATALAGLRTKAYSKTLKFIGRGRGNQVTRRNPEYDASVSHIAGEIVCICDGAAQQCGQARYWYLKGALQQNANLEINSDRTRVESYLSTLGFNQPLLSTLNAAEQDFRASATPFELKNCLGHLRSFLEGLHEQACIPLAAKTGTSAPTQWGKTTAMLRSNGVLSMQEEKLATSMYALISDEGVHPLIAEREYARLLRNMVVEYGLLFLTKMEKAGLTIA